MNSGSVKAIITLMVTWSAILIVSSIIETGTYALEAIGTVDGKTYFYETTLRNWSLSKRRCEEVGLRLATITSPLQYEFLKNQFMTANEWYWIGALEQPTAARFAWIHNNVSLDPSLFPNIELPAVPTCVAYNSFLENEPILQARLCSTENTCVLCEHIHNKKM